MARFSIVTDVGAGVALKTADQVASGLGFTSTLVKDWELSVQKGSLAASILVGAFIAYCDFRLRVEEKPDQTVVITVDRNTPWWTGKIGVDRVNNRAKELADGIVNALVGQGGNILKRSAT